MIDLHRLDQPNELSLQQKQSQAFSAASSLKSKQYDLLVEMKKYKNGQLPLHSQQASDTSKVVGQVLQGVRSEKTATTHGLGSIFG